MISIIKERINNLKTKGFFHILLGGTLTKIIAFFSSIIIVRFVSKTDYAYLTYADNIYSYIYLVIALGMDSALLKYCVGENQHKNKAYFNYAFKLGAAWEIVLIAFLLFFFFVIPIPFPGAKKYIIALLAYPFLYFCICLLQAFMRARLKNKEYAYAGIIQTALVLIVSISLVFSISAFSVVVARYIAAAIVVVYCFKTISTEISVPATSLTQNEKKHFVKFGISILVANIFSMIMPINEIFLVNNLLKDTVITANYKVANLIPQQLTFITSAIITFYFPYFARMTDKAEIWKKSKQIGLFTSGLIIAVVVIGIFISPVIIHIVYGDKYSDINGLMSALWIMHALNAAFRMLPMNFLPAIGYTKFNVIMSVLSCVVHFAIDYFCIIHFGINGAVIAGGIVYSITAACYWGYIYYVTHPKNRGFA